MIKEILIIVGKILIIVGIIFLTMIMFLVFLKFIEISQDSKWFSWIRGKLGL